MPRRRSTKTRSGSGNPHSLNKADGKIKKWNTAHDIPLDEEGQFHASRDKILLDGDNDANYADDDDDEIFALKGIDNSDDEDADGVDDGEVAEEEEKQKQIKAKEKQKPKKKTSKKSRSTEKLMSSSSDESESQEAETWGSGKAAYYSSNAVELESDDEEGNELEEQEARRLQSKMREELGDDDFGLNDALAKISDDKVDDFDQPILAAVPTMVQDKNSCLKHLENTSPETLALARDWNSTARRLTKTRDKLENVLSEGADSSSLGMIHLHYQTLLSYSTTLAFYFHLRASKKYAQKPELLRKHPILKRLLTLKQSLSTLEDLDFALSDSDDDANNDTEGDEEMEWDEMMEDGEHLWKADKTDVLDSDELAELLEDAQVDARSKADQRPKKRRKTTQTKASSESVIAPIFDLEEPEFVSSKTSSKQSSKQNHLDNADTFGEVEFLQQVDAADKSARTKTLRFHTSKIGNASARRLVARNQAAGGDDDIPYRERKKEKDARTTQEAKGRVKKQGGEDLDDSLPPEDTHDKRKRGDDSGESEGSDGYYELVKRNTVKKKEQKKAEYQSAQAAAKPILDEGALGPRSLTRAILVNKGLTPHRPKSVRNPRVKKRLRFDKAKKKVASQKAVYKDGVSNSGRYDGEKSGISRVVKSVRLG